LLSKLSKKGNTLSPLFLNVALEYAVRIGTHQLVAYANDVNLLGDNIDTKKENTDI
jgi:hypothetical protein